jgi:hypothetical protein
VTGVKTPCTPVPGLDVNTHSDGTPGFKPPKKLLEQPGRHTGSTVGRDYIQVLDFTVAAVALSEMAADVAHHPLLSLCEVEDAGLQGLLRMVFPSKVPGHPGVCPARLGVSVASLLQVRNISHSGLTKMNCLGLGQRKDTSTIVAHRSGICTRARANGQRLSCAPRSSVYSLLHRASSRRVLDSTKLGRDFGASSSTECKSAWPTDHAFASPKLPDRFPLCAGAHRLLAPHWSLKKSLRCLSLRGLRTSSESTPYSRSMSSLTFKSTSWISNPLS